MPWYELAKALHIIAVISWMAGIFYLPRLFVYHTQVENGSKEDERFQTMERKLLRVIMNPAMMLTWIAGIAMVVLRPSLLTVLSWFHVKLLLVLVITGFHMACARWRKDFEAGTNNRPEKFYRMVNEIPTVAMIAIVFLVVFQPIFAAGF